MALNIIINEELNYKYNNVNNIVYKIHFIIFDYKLNNNNNLSKRLLKVKELYKFLKLYDIKYNKGECNKLDPINILKQRYNSTPKILCQNGDTSHICYKDDNPLFAYKNGVSCEFRDIIIDPSKWKEDGNIYKGPKDFINKGSPLIFNGFFNIKCKNNIISEYKGYNFIYNKYFQAWNYNYNEDEKLEELAPGKTIFFISRNQDSPNLYHGGSEFINSLSTMYLLNLEPEDIQIVFLESIKINDDPFYYLYKNLISRGGEPIHIRKLKKKYHISNGIHIPINWDSPCFIVTSIPNCRNHRTKTYYFYNKLIDIFIPIKIYNDSFVNYNKEFFYYPKSTIRIKPNDKNENKKIITFQWRRVWPQGRKGQRRILGNGPELSDKISSLLPNNVLLRLVDTASLSLKDQISLMRNTDYLLGTHGAGLSLIIYAPENCIYHEIFNSPRMRGLALFASLSGHKVYRDIIKAEVKKVDGNEYLFFNEKEFVKSVINHVKKNFLV